MVAQRFSKSTVGYEIAIYVSAILRVIFQKDKIAAQKLYMFTIPNDIPLRTTLDYWKETSYIMLIRISLIQKIHIWVSHLSSMTPTQGKKSRIRAETTSSFVFVDIQLPFVKSKWHCFVHNRERRKVHCRTWPPSTVSLQRADQAANATVLQQNNPRNLLAAHPTSPETLQNSMRPLVGQHRPSFIS